ncbi:hypothetical protein CVIRNUC_010304 [Coccomyxa viridis]|uniref:Dynein light chain n=1 Tax=Coccomyxa viridis TaxID=1274662 RepID=A0AAV1IIH8_9CHLO|nr:hypothetical protein CVIRNUC_010304 [Coccomyxa viridis]
MESDVKDEAADICVAAAEKYKDNLEKAAQVIKDALDKKFGGRWHVVIGTDFAHRITHEV